MLTTLEFRFRKNSWKLEVAADMPACLRKTKTQSPDLVIVDLEISPEQGLETIRQLAREYGKALPVIAAASLENGDLLLESLQAGAQDFIITPYKPDELILRIRRLLKFQKVES